MKIRSSTLFSILLLFVSIEILPAQTTESQKDQIVKVGVRAHSGIEAAKTKWTPTIDYISQSIKGYTFEIVPLVTFDDMRAAVERNEVQFVLTNPTAYIDLNVKYSVARIATLINRRVQNGFTEFGGVVFTRADRDDITVLSDVKGKSIMGVHKEAFGGWRMAQYELLEIGIDPFNDCSEVLFSPKRTHEGIVSEVLQGNVDIGTVRTGILEKMAKSGSLDLKNIKIIEPKKDDFPLPHTTRLYPEWPFASLNNTDELLAKKTAIALFQMDKDNPAAVQGGYTGWKVPLGYSQVLLLLKALKVSPFDDYEKTSVLDFFKRYWFWFLLTVLTVLVLMLIVIHISGLNHKLEDAHSKLEDKVVERTAELNQANTELHSENKKRREAEEAIKEKMVKLERTNQVLVGRELRMIDLKNEINALLEKAGLPKKYQPDAENE